MRKSEHYTFAMKAVLEYEMQATQKLEVLETLMEDRKLAVFSETPRGEEAKA